MIQEAIEKVERLAVRAESVQQLKLEGDRPGRSYLYDRSTNELQEMETEVAGRDYSAGTLEELAKMVTNLSEQLGAESAAKVFVDEKGVTAVLNENGRRDERIVMPFARSEAFTTLANLFASARPFTQREFIWLLRTTFKDMVAEPFDLLGQVRVVKFKQDSAGMATIKTGQESISREAMASVMTDAGQGFPEDATLRVPVFADLVDESGEQCEIEVECAVDVRVDKQEFVLRPIPGELEKAKRKTLSWVQSVLAAKLDGVEVFIGSAG